MKKLFQWACVVATMLGGVAAAADKPAVEFQEYARTASGSVRLVYLFTSSDRNPIAALTLELHDLLALDQVEPDPGWSASHVQARAARLTPALPLHRGASTKVAVTLHVVDPAPSNPFLSRRPPAPFEVTATLANGEKVETRAEPLYLGN
jgi:hypothetical protein